MENRTVVFVDDEAIVLNSLKRVFADEPYRCLFAEGGREALALMAENEAHVVVTDMQMPGMSGLELLSTVNERYPSVIRVILTGCVDVKVLLEAINRGLILRFIVKPWKIDEEFRTVVRQALEYYDLRSELDLLAELVKRLTSERNVDDLSCRMMRQAMLMRNKRMYHWSGTSKPVLSYR